MRKLLAGLLIAATCAAPASARAEINREQQVKAAYLYNFARFATWPAAKFSSDTQPIRFCVLEGEPLEPAIREALADKSVNLHPAQVVTLRQVELMRDCHVAYFGREAESRIAAGLQSLAGSAVLTVHESAGPHTVGIIRLFVADARLRFEVNVAAAEREHVVLSAHLLNVAKAVKD